MLLKVEEVLKKNSLSDKLNGEWWNVHSAGDLVMCLGDIGRHMGRRIGGFHGAHVWHGVGERCLEGRMLQAF